MNHEAMMTSYNTSFIILVVVTTTIAVSIAILLFHHFGPGHEEDSKRSDAPLSAKEINLKTMAKHTTSYLLRERSNNSKDKVKICTNHWYPSKDPRAIIVLLHGMGDYGNRSLDGAKELLLQGFAVYTIDHEGFGRSSGRHGYLPNVRTSIEDVIYYIDTIVSPKATELQKKIFVMGGSLGGMMIIYAGISYELQSRVDGAIIQCPAVHIHKDSRPNVAVELVGKALRRVLPKLPVIAANRGKGCSPEVAVQNELDKLSDKLFYNGKLRIGTGLAILDALAAIENELHNFKIPYLLQHGTSDRVCHVSGSEEFHSATNSSDKTFVRYDNGAHDLFHEPPAIRNKLFKDVDKWITKRI